ncbi:MAG TPA: hypothetical protein VGM74_04065 [Burkholderiaceae bacterium]|jgi:hypothetical protein
MGQGFGMEHPGKHVHETHEPPAKYLVVIDSGGSGVARLFLADRREVAEFDAGAEEVTQMVSGLAPHESARGPEWDRALAGHSAAERAAAEVYLLEP